MRPSVKVAALATAALTAGGLGAVLAPAYADGPERHGSCSGATYDFEVERETGGFEISFDLDHATPGSRWVVALRHDGKRYFHKTLTALDDDGDGEFDVDQWRADSSGKDTFSVRFREAGTKNYCSAKIRMS
ncbi:hypothetical protein [Nocardioides sp.]|uniref:hypothetical protein n=1 Tax=Nocardioides sp. TaxID=35761 RepID=UPI0039E3A392